MLTLATTTTDVPIDTIKVALEYTILTLAVVLATLIAIEYRRRL